MKLYAVGLSAAHDSEPDGYWIEFYWADDDEHAEEQARNAHPHAAVLSTPAAVSVGSAGGFPYRLVRVQHERCGEYDGTEYVLSPLDWPEDKVRGMVREVVAEMIADAKAVQASPLQPPHAPPYGDYPDKTVEAVQALHAEQKAAYDAWLKENRRLERSFVERLRERGFVALWDETGQDGAYTVGTHWGHNHGLDLDYEHAHI